VNDSTGPRFHSTPLHRLKSSKTGRPRRCERVSFRQVPSAGKPRIRALPKLPPSQRPQNQSDLCHPGKTQPLRPPDTPATARVSPGRQKSEQRGPAPRPGPAALLSSAPAWHRECQNPRTPNATPNALRLNEIDNYILKESSHVIPTLIIKALQRFPSA